MSAMKDIVAMDDVAVLLELAEECNELAKAATKLALVRAGRKPVPEDTARENLIEEMADVQVELHAARLLLSPAERLRMRAGAREKEQRMYDRLLPAINAALKNGGKNEKAHNGQSAE